MGYKPTKILIVEDNPDHAELMEEVLLKHNNSFEINTVVFGEECLAMLDKVDYDVVLLDYTLPKLDGLEVLREIIEKGYHVPVIMMTGYEDERIGAEARKLGAYDCINKSWNYLLTLPFVVEKTIKQYSVAKENEDSF